MRIGGLVHARMTSERLPGKPLIEIEGRASILHILDRMAACRHLSPDRIVLCTTTNPADDPLAEAFAAAGGAVFRGSPLDVIDRFWSAATAFDFDAVVQVDGDDTCVDTGVMDAVMDRLLADDETDVVLATGFPLGIASKAIRGSALDRVHDAYVPGDNSTGASYYFTRSGLCNVARVHPALPAQTHDTARLTLDEPEDLALFRAIFAALHDPAAARPFGVEEIVALLHEQPGLLELNAGLNDRYFQRSDRLVAAERLSIRHPDGTLEEVSAASNWTGSDERAPRWTQ